MYRPCLIVIILRFLAVEAVEAYLFAIYEIRQEKKMISTYITKPVNKACCRWLADILIIKFAFYSKIT